MSNRKSSEKIIEMVQENHRNKEDFYEGDLIDRIEGGYYTLEKIAISLIYSPWAIDEDLVDSFLNKPKKSMPPIIVDEELTIIDGTHRYEAAKKRGDKFIICWKKQLI